MKRFKVTWQFEGGYEMSRTSVVLAQDRKHAEQRVWMLHVEPSQLRSKIKFLLVEEIESLGVDDEGREWVKWRR